MAEKELTEAEKKKLDRKIEQLEKRISKIHQEYDTLTEELEEVLLERHPERREERIKETLYHAYQKSSRSMEEILVYKDVRNGINRQVNCEAANLLKSVSAATRQREDIEYIRDSVGLDTLPEPLAEMAEVRLQFPDAPLKDLGQHLSPPVGKSGVNHRLRKLSEYADELRGRRSI